MLPTSWPRVRIPLLRPWLRAGVECSSEVEQARFTIPCRRTFLTQRKHMTRRKRKRQPMEALNFRSERIQKLIDRGWIQSASEIPLDVIPVDPEALNLGHSWERPLFYRDLSFQCRDCGVQEIWSAVDQQWYYESAGGYFFNTAVRCRSCRQIERQRKAEARLQAGHDAK